jgi:hypothetical protein
MTTALEEGERLASRPGRSLPPEKTQYPLYRRLGAPQSRSGQVRKISPAPGFDPQTVQPIASRYTDYATRPTNYWTVYKTTIYMRTLFIHARLTELLEIVSFLLLGNIQQTARKRSKIFWNNFPLARTTCLTLYPHKTECKIKRGE